MMGGMPMDMMGPMGMDPMMMDANGYDGTYGYGPYDDGRNGPNG